MSTKEPSADTAVRSQSKAFGDHSILNDSLKLFGMQAPVCEQVPLRVFQGRAGLSPGVEYKSVSVSPTATAAEVVETSIERFGAEWANPADFGLRLLRTSDKEGHHVRKRSLTNILGKSGVINLNDDDIVFLAMEKHGMDNRRLEVYLRNKAAKRMPSGSSASNVFHNASRQGSNASLQTQKESDASTDQVQPKQETELEDQNHSAEAHQEHVADDGNPQTQTSITSEAYSAEERMAIQEHCACVVIVYPDGRREIAALPEGTSVLGSSNVRADVVVDDPKILPVHCDLAVQGMQVGLLPREQAIVYHKDDVIEGPVILEDGAVLNLGPDGISMELRVSDPNTSIRRYQLHKIEHHVSPMDTDTLTQLFGPVAAASLAQRGNNTKGCRKHRESYRLAESVDITAMYDPNAQAEAITEEDDGDDNEQLTSSEGSKRDSILHHQGEDDTMMAGQGHTTTTSEAEQVAAADDDVNADDNGDNDSIDDELEIEEMQSSPQALRRKLQPLVHSVVTPSQQDENVPQTGEQVTSDDDSLPEEDPPEPEDLLQGSMTEEAPSQEDPSAVAIADESTKVEQETASETSSIVESRSDSTSSPKQPENSTQGAETSSFKDEAADDSDVDDDDDESYAIRHQSYIAAVGSMSGSNFDLQPSDINTEDLLKGLGLDESKDVEEDQPVDSSANRVAVVDGDGADSSVSADVQVTYDVDNATADTSLQHQVIEDVQSQVQRDQLVDENAEVVDAKLASKDDKGDKSDKIGDGQSATQLKQSSDQESPSHVAGAVAVSDSSGSTTVEQEQVPSSSKSEAPEMKVETDQRRADESRSTNQEAQPSIRRRNSKGGTFKRTRSQRFHQAASVLGLADVVPKPRRSSYSAAVCGSVSGRASASEPQDAVKHHEAALAALGKQHNATGTVAKTDPSAKSGSIPSMEPIVEVSSPAQNKPKTTNDSKDRNQGSTDAKRLASSAAGKPESTTLTAALPKPKKQAPRSMATSASVLTTDDVKPQKEHAREAKAPRASTSTSSSGNAASANTPPPSLGEQQKSRSHSKEDFSHLLRPKKASQESLAGEERSARRQTVIGMSTSQMSGSSDDIDPNTGLRRTRRYTATALSKPAGPSSPALPSATDMGLRRTGINLRSLNSTSTSTSAARTGASYAPSREDMGLRSTGISLMSLGRRTSASASRPAGARRYSTGLYTVKDRVKLFSNEDSSSA